MKMSRLKCGIEASFINYNTGKQELLDGSSLLVIYVHQDLHLSSLNDRVVLNSAVFAVALIFDVRTSLPTMWPCTWTMVIIVIK